MIREYYLPGYRPVILILTRASPRRRTSEIIFDVARLLRTTPAALYRLNPLFEPHGHVDLNIRYSPVTSLILKTHGISCIMILDSDYEGWPNLHNLSTSQLRETLSHCDVGDPNYDALHGIASPALRDSLAQLAQEVSTDI